MKREYDFAGAERGKFFRKGARSAFPQNATAEVFIDRDGYTVVVLPDGFHFDSTAVRVGRYGKRAILMPIKKRRARVQPRTRLTTDFRKTVRARAKRDPVFRKGLSDEIKRGL